MKYKWYKIILFLCYINITFAMSCSSIYNCQMTMISNLIIFFSHNDIVISVFKMESRFIF